MVSLPLIVLNIRHAIQCIKNNVVNDKILQELSEILSFNYFCIRFYYFGLSHDLRDESMRGQELLLLTSPLTKLIAIPSALLLLYLILLLTLNLLLSTLTHPPLTLLLLSHLPPAASHSPALAPAVFHPPHPAVFHPPQPAVFHPPRPALSSSSCYLSSSSCHYYSSYIHVLSLPSFEYLFSSL